MAIPAWVAPLATGSQLSELAESVQSPVAAYGRVLGDRSTLYKYLNPHAIAFSTITGKESTGSVKVVDSSTGEVIYSAELREIDPSRGIQVALADNWLVYAYMQRPTDKGGSSGQRLVSAELFEGREDERLTR